MHVDPEEDLDLESDWNILRGRTVPDEVFHIQSRSEGHALLRLKCHDFRKERDDNGRTIPRQWVASVIEVLYVEPQVEALEDFQRLVKRDRIDLPQTACYPTLAAATKALHIARKATRIRLRNRQREVADQVAKLRKEADGIDAVINGWPELPGGPHEESIVTDFGPSFDKLYNEEPDKKPDLFDDFFDD